MIKMTVYGGQETRLPTEFQSLSTQLGDASGTDALRSSADGGKNVSLYRLTFPGATAVGTPGQKRAEELHF